MSATPSARILQVVLDEVLQAKPDQFIGQRCWEILGDNRRKRRGEDMLKPGRTK